MPTFELLILRANCHVNTLSLVRLVSEKVETQAKLSFYELPTLPSPCCCPCPAIESFRRVLKCLKDLNLETFNKGQQEYSPITFLKPSLMLSIEHSL